MNEWDELAKWVVAHKLHSPHQRWLVQVPRIFFLYRKLGMVQNFQELLDSPPSLSSPSLTAL